MFYEELCPSGRAAECVETYWRFAFDEPGDPDRIEHRIVPDGMVSLHASFAGESILGVAVSGAGTLAHTLPIEKGLRVAGIRLRPGAARALLGVDPLSLSAHPAPLDAVSSIDTGWISESFAGAWRRDAAARFDSVIAERWTGAGDRLVLAAADRILASWGRTRIATLASEIGLSPRQFRDRFAREAGLSPKAFAQVRRQRAAWIALVTGRALSLSDASYLAGYADQAHFSREARDAFSQRASDVRSYVSTIRHRFEWLERAGESAAAA